MGYLISGKVTGYVAGTDTIDAFADFETTSLGAASTGMTPDGNGDFSFNLGSPDVGGSERVWISFKCRNAVGDLIDSKVIGPYVVSDVGAPL